RALELLAQPKGRARGAAPEPLRTVGNHPEDGAPILLFSGRYGFYVKHGEKTATVGRGEGFDAEKLTVEQAVTALANAPDKKTKGRRAAGAKSGAKAAPGSKAAARPAAKKTAAATKPKTTGTRKATTR